MGTPTALGRAVLDATTLDELQAALRACVDETHKSGARSGIGVRHRFLFQDLPKFGGPKPADTFMVFSWDETRVLKWGGEWKIEDRQGL